MNPGYCLCFSLKIFVVVPNGSLEASHGDNSNKHPHVFVQKFKKKSFLLEKKVVFFLLLVENVCGSS